MQNEIEGDLRERRVQAAVTNFHRIGRPPHFRDQAVTGGECEVIV